MASKNRRGESSDYGGMDAKLMKSIVSKIPPNPETGRVSLPDVLRYMSQSSEEMENLMTVMKDLDLEKHVNLSGYDFVSLGPTIKHESFWVFQLETMGLADASGKPVANSSNTHLINGLQPSFIIYCYDDQETHRITHECVGLPNSNTVLQVLQRAIAKPLPPLKPCLPWFLLLSIKFQQHIPELKPFLDSLPAPFHWRLETREEAEALNEGIFQKNQEGVRRSLESANKYKSIGNAAFAKKDRMGALQAYSEYILDALCQTPSVEDERSAKKILAICNANRAAAYLIAGEGIDVNKALQDGKAAEEADPNYAKAYIRQATAYQALGNLEAAKVTIARALHLRELENDKGLADRLINLYTNGKGFSNDEGTFKSWILDNLVNDKESSKRLSGIKGEWRRRYEEQLAKWS